MSRSKGRGPLRTLTSSVMHIGFSFSKGQMKATTQAGSGSAPIGTPSQKYPCIGDVRGRGLLLGVEFRALDRNENHSARALSDAVTDRALHLGLSANIVRTGASDGVMRIAPPLTATDAEIDLGLELLDAALERTVENLRPVRDAPALAAVGA